MIALILAAGVGSRFTGSGGAGHKLDALLAGKPVLWHVLQAVEAAGLRAVVVRPQGGTAGMGDSIALGVRQAPQAEGWLILPGDLPLVQAQTISRVARALRTSPIVVPHHGQQRGHPVGFQNRYYAELSALQGEHGAAGIVRASRSLGQVLDLAVDDEGAVFDIDTQEDLQAAERLYAERARIGRLNNGRH